MKLYFIRHGQSLGNAIRMHSTQLQVPLTEQGENDARIAGSMIRHIPFDKVYTSDLKRAVQTCQIALPGVEFEQLEILREIDVGSLMGRYVEDCIAQYGQSYVEHKRDNDFLCYGGENDEMLSRRIRQFLTMMEKTPYEKVAVFGHEMYIRTVMNVITGFYHDKATTPCHNGSVSVFEFKDGHWRLDSWNVRPL